MKFPAYKHLILSGILALQATACFGTVTPLAPGLRGSVGQPSNGVLTEPTELPRSGPGFVRYRPWGDRNYGTSNLVHAIEQVAARVQTDAGGGPPLVVGDLSARNGGKISRHASHRSGRDVDLLLFTTTLDQVPIVAPGFVHFGADGLAQLPDRRFVALDIRRQWLLTRALLTEPTIDVLWMFVSRDIEAYLVDYAKSLGEPDELILKAARTLHQPRDSANHDDHVHLRIACNPEERSLGCEGGGPQWPWLRPPSYAESVSLYHPWDTDEPNDPPTEPSQVPQSRSALAPE